MEETYNLTDRTLAFTDRQFDRSEYFLSNEIVGWPKDARVLICGSGTRGALEYDLKQTCPTFTTISIDPTLSFDPKEQQIVDLAAGEVVLYSPIDSVLNTLAKVLKGQDAENFHDSRVESHHSDFPIAAKGQHMPLAGSTIDVVIDVLGPMHYLRMRQNDLLGYISELARVLKPGGVAYLYDADQSVLLMVKALGSFSVLSSPEYLKDDYFILKIRRK